jgi:diguanylate cyclase (GGDEF)-like protein
MSTILLLDDDPLFRRLVLEVLERRGHQVVEVGTLNEATEWVEGRTPDLVIVDGALPDGSGLEWIRTFRKKDDRTPIIFVSASWRDPESFRVLTKELRVGLVAHKPVVPAIFGEQVESQLEDSAVFRRGTGDDDDVIAALRADYARKLPERIANLRDVVLAARAASGGDPEIWESARQLAHKLKGTTGSYGFLEISGMISHVEDSVRKSRGGDESAWIGIEGVFASLDKAVAHAVDQTASASQRPFVLATATLLVVDEDPAFLAAVVEVGRQQLVDVTVATTAVDALQKAREHPPDAAMLGLRTEHSQDALVLAGDLRAVPGCESLPFAFVSDDGQIENRVAAAHAGASLFLAKPIDEGAFGAAVRQLVAAQQSDRPHVLVLDDDEAFSTRVAVLLRSQGMHVTTLNEPARTLETLEELRPDLLLCDVMMPGISGFDVCRMLRTTPAWQALPVLFLTAKAGVETRVAAFQAGADDYLAKPIVTEELLARVRVRIDRSRLLRERASRDMLTGLLLRAPFVERTTALLAHAKRHDRPLTVCLLDLDLFKAINDERGHLAGDRVLAGLGKLLASRFRAEDVRARWGGEEFVLAFEGELGETIQNVLTRVLSEFRAMAFPGEDGNLFSSTFSGGVATFPGDGETLPELLRVADRRLYRAKARGRARVVADD